MSHVDAQVKGQNTTLTGFVMNVNAVKRGGVYEAVNVSAPRTATVADEEASREAVEILKRIVSERAAKAAKQSLNR